MFNQLFLRGAIAVAIVAQFSAVSGAEDEPPEKLDWQDYLMVVGSNTGIRFTVEVLETSTSPMVEQTRRGWVHGNTDIKTSREIINVLSKNCDWLECKIDATQDRVIHVADNRLTSFKGYALEKTVDVEFVGVPADLCLHLNRQVANLEPKRGGTQHDIFDDHILEIAVESRGKIVREVLTKCVPHACYSPVLWRAATVITETDSDTKVQFYGIQKLNDDAGGKLAPWLGWIYLAGKRLNCYFTIETVYRNADDARSCPVLFAKTEAIETTDALITELSKRVPHLMAVKDVRRPEIIHIIDKELLTLRDYGINQRGDLDYVGTPDGLAQSINAVFSSVGPLLSEASQTPLKGDKTTRIEVHSKGQQLRSMLTDSIPLENRRRSHVLWHARTWVRNTGPKTSVHF